MKLLLKEKVFAPKDRFNVTDEQEQPLYSVEGKFFSWGHQFDVEDASGAHVAHIQRQNPSRHVSRQAPADRP